MRYNKFLKLNFVGKYFVKLRYTELRLDIEKKSLNKQIKNMLLIQTESSF